MDAIIEEELVKDGESESESTGFWSLLTILPQKAFQLSDLCTLQDGQPALDGHLTEN